jgi:hypothetical protein
MTHTRPYTEEEIAAGEFSQPQYTQAYCRMCDIANVTVQSWDSACGGYTDYKYTCKTCGHHWWIDWPDS